MEWIGFEERTARGVYEILEGFSKEGLGAQSSVAYRTLSFLLAHGFVHKIERLNAFNACAHPLEAYAPAFMSCRSCEFVAEAEGLCPNCLAAEAA